MTDVDLAPSANVILALQTPVDAQPGRLIFMRNGAEITATEFAKRHQLGERALALLVDQEFEGTEYYQLTDTYLRVCSECNGLEPKQLETRQDLTFFNKRMSGKHPPYNVGHSPDCEWGKVCEEARKLR